jgi:hypothetical protein
VSQLAGDGVKLYYVNLEEPAEFNRLCLGFIDQAQAASR